MTNIWRTRLCAAQFLTEYATSEDRMKVVMDFKEDIIIRRSAIMAMDTDEEAEWLRKAAVGDIPMVISLSSTLLEMANAQIEFITKLHHIAPDEIGTPISRPEAIEKAEEIMRTAEEERRSILDHPLPFTWYTKEPPRVDGLLVCADDGVWKRTMRWDAKEESWYLEGPKPRFKTAFCVWASWKHWMIIEE